MRGIVVGGRSSAGPIDPSIDILVLAGPADAASRWSRQLADVGLELGECREPADRQELVAALADDGGSAAPRPVAVLDGRVIMNSTPLGAVLDDPRVESGALAFDDAGRWSELGVLKVEGRHRRLAAAGIGSVGIGSAASGPDGDLVLELIQSLESAGVPVRPVPLGGYVWARTDRALDGPPAAGQAQVARDAVAGLDERRTRLREAARGGDGFYSTFVLRKLSWRLTGLLERTGLTPNQVTLASFTLGLVAAGFLAVGSRPWAVAGALLLQFCLVVDCVDGELARYRRRFSRFGAWLDATTDRVKEFATIAALAVAGFRGTQHRDLWWLAAAAIGLQTVRNLLDLGWSLQRAAVQRAAVQAAEGAAPAATWVATPAGLRLPVRPAGGGAAAWIRRIGHFPIGERFLLISIGAAFGTARGTLVALLVAGLLATAYLLAAFVARCRSSRAPAPALERLADAGPGLTRLIAHLSAGRAGRVATALPALLAGAELALTWWLAEVVAGAPGWAALALLGAVALAHYQQAYGVREDSGAAPAGGFGPMVGADLRLVLLGLVAIGFAAAAGGHANYAAHPGHPDHPDAAAVAVLVLAALVALSSTVRSRRRWTAPAAEPPPTAGPAPVVPGEIVGQPIGGVR